MTDREIIAYLKENITTYYPFAGKVDPALVVYAIIEDLEEKCKVKYEIEHSTLYNDEWTKAKDRSQYTFDTYEEAQAKIDEQEYNPNWLWRIVEV